MSLADKKSALFSTSKSTAAKPSSSSGSGGALSSSSSSTTTTAGTTTRPVGSSGVTGVSGGGGGAGPTAGATSFLGRQGAGQSEAARIKKLAEARELSEQGTKYLETSLFQWKPDHVAAASYFERASEVYRSAGDLDSARRLMLAAADAHEASGAHAACAIDLIKAAKIAHDQGTAPQGSSGGDVTRIKDATKLYLRAAENWGIHGDVEKAADATFKAAVEVEDVNPAKGMEFYRRAVDLAYPPDLITKEAVGRLHPLAVDMCRQYFSVLLRREMYGAALDFAPRLILLYEAFESESSLHKTLCAVSVLQLREGDVVAAHETFLQDHLSRPSYLASSECRLAENLVMAFVRLDVDALDTALNSADMRFMDREVIKVAKTLSLFAAKTTVRLPEVVLPSAVTPAGRGKEEPSSAALLGEDEADEGEEREGGAGSAEDAALLQQEIARHQQLQRAAFGDDDEEDEIDLT